MKTETLPSGVQIPKIGFGTWNVGGGMSPDYSQDARALAGIRTALKIGYTHIDTAEMYAHGHSEELVAGAIRETGIAREKLFITTKVWHNNLRYDQVLAACEGSLQRLETGYIDLYLIHWPGSAPLSETFRALNDLQASGKIRHVGVSNFDLALLKRARSLCDSPLLTNQVPYSLYTRRYVENGVLDYCQENGILLTAYTPVEKGRIKNDGVVRQIARHHHATPVQVALAWLVQQPGVIAIPMSLNPKHIKENFKAADIQLSPEEMLSLNRLG